MASASIEDLGGGRWRVRWRERQDRGPWAQRERVIHGAREDAEEYRLAVIRDLRDRGGHDAAAHDARTAPPANLLDGLLAWVEAAERDGLRPSSGKGYRGIILRLARAIHDMTGIPTTEPLPVTLLSRNLFDSLKPILTRRGEAIPSRDLRVLWQGWGWLADAPEDWPQTPRRPSSARGYVPPEPVYAPTIAPTLVEVDACLRYLRGRIETAWQGRPAVVAGALVMRFTGLRVGQVQGIHREDVDLDRRTLRVRVGKSRQERAAQRTVPLSRHLLAEPLFQAYLQIAPTKGRLFPTLHSNTMRRAWEVATEAGEVRRETWDPPQRRNSRPDHAFRAAFQAHMTRERVPADVVDHLVGHAGTLRSTHYGRDIMEDAFAAVDALPPVDWRGPQPVADNVVPLHAQEGSA